MVGSSSRADSAPSSISDVLYLIAAHHVDIFNHDTAQNLNTAHICFIRGDLRAALRAIDTVLGDLDISQAAYADMLAFRLLIVSLIDQDSAPRVTGPADGAHARPGALRVVSLCVESNKLWYSGSLFKGLSTNQSAIQHSRDASPVWRMYADFLLVKKLSDIHVSHQASTVISGMHDLIENAGLHAFESLLDALRSVLHLQSGQFERAIVSATAAIRIAEQRATKVGVKLALSVSATAHLGLGDRDKAAASLTLFHAEPTYYIMPDSVARAAFVELALVASREGPRAAADRIRAKWHLLGTGSACCIEDITRPAWLVGIARRAGDTALAERCLKAIERLASNNHEVSLLETAAEHARATFAGEQPGPSSILDCRPPAMSIDRALPEPDVTGSASGRSARLSTLSRREGEIARLVSSGLTNQQVANQLGLSPHTVNFHLRSIFRKLSISTRVKLNRIIAQSDRQQDSPVSSEQQR
ncbi:LuxR C-terminal-related transcriptional regulator [Umezawaea sp. Da 62-37]|uniref:helix-turn-helix transcriptional regulator n=1 Tax=Umezawaea sp. Da 62-37 TaxID=3075927 RepID=UPI0028F70021|nr:LuxR C-terminal-related transcriptional regulator [Umezawaea sp. Da 62-37]WNV85261.1 LuxR C-terminal-related transcriptional regulator [Umezawaea sp. Da 62-37]